MYLDIFVNFLTTRICKKKIWTYNEWTQNWRYTYFSSSFPTGILLEYNKFFKNLQVWEPAVVLLILLVVVSEHVRAEKSLNLLIIFNTNFAQKSLYLEYDGFC